MREWLHQEIAKRLTEQASFLVTKHENALWLTTGDFIPEADHLAKKVVVQDRSELISQVPGAHFDIVLVHLLPGDMDLQLLIWQQLSCLVKEGAALFFSAWSVDTFKEWRNQSPLIEFQDMHNIGDGLAQAGWTDTVMSSQKMQVTYENIASLLCDAEIVGLKPSRELIMPQKITYEIAFGHAVFSRKLKSRQLGEYEVTIDR
jgi:hypothetical protein